MVVSIYMPLRRMLVSFENCIGVIPSGDIEDLSPP